MIMGDTVDTLEWLLAPDGLDHGRLTEAEQEANDISRLSYTDHERKVLRHFEGAAEPAKILCKFLQDDDNAYAYILLNYQVAIEDTAAPMMAIFEDISRMDFTKDLRNRGERTVLVKRSDVVVDPDVAKNYTKVETMEPCVQQYCELYTEDLSERLGLNKPVLEPYLTNSVLLNPMFGYERRVVCSGLMTTSQYERAHTRECLKSCVLFSSTLHHAHQEFVLCPRSNPRLPGYYGY